MLKKEDYRMIEVLNKRGVYLKDIADELGVDPKTVRRALKRGGAPVKERQKKASKLEPYKKKIDQLLSDDVWNTRVILREIQAEGYTGGYTGQRDLDNTGLMDYKARFYDGSLGKFIQPDSIVSNPLNPQTWNRYAYVSNNPVRYNDPKRACPPPVYFLKILALAESRSRTPIPRWKAMA